MVSIIAVAALLRLWQLDAAPPGLYRDEAYNGLDAMGVLQGRHAVYFTANNGREPAYIYLTALALSLLGRTVLAVRFTAALSGILTTGVVYLLGRSWFGARVGLFAAWLWAITLWPVHLSRVGLRPILLPFLLTLVFWLGTLAYRRGSLWLWLGAGLAYGAAFYTYLAVRFTPILLVALLSYLLLKHRRARSRLWPGVLWFGLGTLVTLSPLAFAALQDPNLIIGRVGQVSIFNPEIGGPNPLVTLTRQTGRALGMFLWSGDTILRHNPAGRPVFDLLMAAPFLIGLVYCLRHWRQKASAALLLWVAVMLGPTILAEDAPHFLRAVGVLPAALYFPALGLSKIWEWPKLADALRRGLVLLLVLGTLIVTVSDYVHFVRQPDTAYLFEAAARELAQRVNADGRGVDVFVDRRFRDGWPSLRFLLDDTASVSWYAAQDGIASPAAPPATIYAWPYDSLDFVAGALDAPVLISITEGPLTRGDLEPQPYPLYVRYEGTTTEPSAEKIVFDERFALHDASLENLPLQRLQVDLHWSTREPEPAPPVPTVFVHVVPQQVAPGAPPLGQSDGPLAQGYWPVAAWQPGQVIHERRIIDMQEPLDLTHHEILVGIYDAVTGVRLSAYSPQGELLGDSWRLTDNLRTHEEN